MEHIGIRGPGEGENGDIVFETGSGISIEEQKEILAGIESMAGAGRGVDAPIVLPSGRDFFPLGVNLGALVLLVLGALGIFFFYQREDAEIREGSSYMGITERKLIQEIRQETARRIGEKEAQISDITAKLSGVDAEYQELQSSIERMLAEKEAELRRAAADELEAERRRLNSQNLSEAAIAEQMRSFNEQRISRLDAELAAYKQRLDAEKAGSQANLLRLQEEYRNDLAALNAERAKILEDSRIREANLRSQLEEELGILSTRAEENRAELSAAREELRRLSEERERTALVEGQIGGFYQRLGALIGESRFDEAEGVLVSMTEFLNTPSFLGVRALQSRRGTHLAQISALSALIAGSRRFREEEGALNAQAAASGERGSGGLPSPGEADRGEDQAALESLIAGLRAENALLEEKNRDQGKTIESFSAQGSDLSRRLAEYDKTVTDLRAQTAAQQRSLNEKDTTIAGLRRESSAQLRQLTERQNALTSLQTAQQQQASGLQTQNSGLQQQLAERNSAVAALQTENNELKTRVDQLNQAAETSAAAMNELRAENAAQSRNIQTLNTELTAIRQALRALGSE
jgi:chromosome segregation ATPase